MIPFEGQIGHGERLDKALDLGAWGGSIQHILHAHPYHLLNQLFAAKQILVGAINVNIFLFRFRFIDVGRKGKKQKWRIRREGVTYKQFPSLQIVSCRTFLQCRHTEANTAHRVYIIHADPFQVHTVVTCMRPSICFLRDSSARASTVHCVAAH